MFLAVGSLVLVIKSAVSDEPAKTDWRTTGSWSKCEFGGDGPIKISQPQFASAIGDKPAIRLEAGDPMTAVYWSGQSPRDNFRWSFEAKRVSGFDFFAAATFPIADGQATFVPGGWGGGITGLSNIDGKDASNNETSQYVAIESDRWYRIDIQVTTASVQCFLDGKKLIDVARAGKTFEIRDEMDLCLPFGIAAYQSDSLIRNIRLVTLPPNSIAAIQRQTIHPATEDAGGPKSND